MRQSNRIRRGASALPSTYRLPTEITASVSPLRRLPPITTPPRRRQYLESLVRQDIAFFDKEDSGALLARVVSDTNAIQEALSSKLAVCLQHFGAALVGVIIGLVKGWKMALVLLAVMPLLGTAGALFGKTMQAGQKEQSEAYAKASALAKETIGAVRVVAAYGGEERFMAAFAAACLPAEKSERRSALSGGFSVGFLWLTMFGTCAPSPHRLLSLPFAAPQLWLRPSSFLA